MNNIRSTLLACEAYFEERADADGCSDGTFTGNEEMSLLGEVREALRAVSMPISGQEAEGGLYEALSAFVNDPHVRPIAGSLLIRGERALAKAGRGGGEPKATIKAEIKDNRLLIDVERAGVPAGTKGVDIALPADAGTIELACDVLMFNLAGVSILQLMRAASECLASADRSPQGQDPAEGLDAKHESAVRDSADAQNPLEPTP